MTDELGQFIALRVYLCLLYARYFYRRSPALIANCLVGAARLYSRTLAPLSCWHIALTRQAPPCRYDISQDPENNGVTPYQSSAHRPEPQILLRIIVSAMLIMHEFTMCTLPSGLWPGGVTVSLLVSRFGGRKFNFRQFRLHVTTLWATR